jgi:hypothetical protein
MEILTGLSGWVLAVIGAGAVLAALVIAAFVWLLTHPLD